MFLLEERVVASKEDMDAVEEFVMAQLGCENHRCAFFRSRDYVRFRMAAVYGRECWAPCSVYFERLCLRLEAVEGVGRVVRVLLNQDMVFFGSKEGIRDVVGPQERARKKKGTKRCAAPEDADVE